MFKTIFSKWMTIILFVILASYSIAGVLLYGLLGNYAVTEKEKTLKHYADRIIEMAQYLANSNNPIVQDVFCLNIQGYASNSNSIILIVDNSGQIVLTSNPSLKYLEGKKIEESILKDIQSGNEVRRIGNLGNIFDQSLLTLGYPIKYNRQIIGGVLLNTTLPELERLKFEVFGLFMKAIIISILAAVPIILLMSKKISKPLTQLGKAAAKIAGGDYDSSVDIKTNDEFGELGKTFNYMAQRLANLEKTRRSFIENVSHELRTPLTSINGFVEGIIDETIPSDKQKHYLSIVKNETVRLTKLVNDLLDLAKVESIDKCINMKPFDIVELLRVCILKFEPQITAKKIEISLELHADSQLVFADSDSINRVVTNLMDNAVKFTPDCGKIQIKSVKENKIVYISISDTGVGIDAEDLPFIWDRFYKSDKSRSLDKAGSGLGLAIIKNIMKQHNQNVWVESEVGKGSYFTFTLDEYQIKE